jgi:hydrogenase/urease accessory protein HupE
MHSQRLLIIIKGNFTFVNGESGIIHGSASAHRLPNLEKPSEFNLGYTL